MKRGDGTAPNSVKFEHSNKLALGINHLLRIYTEATFDWQIRNTEGGFSALPLNEPTLKAIYDTIITFIQGCFTTQQLKK